MQFETGRIFHVYNQGNNRQEIFFDRDNYLFFLEKIRVYILPYVDILAWCLMPNHFHLMVLVNKVASPSGSATSSRAPTGNTPADFNKSIGIMLASYTRAINNQQKRSGSLFRPKTKAECVNCIDGITPSFIISEGTTFINVSNPEKQYPQVCFNYIHNNPVKAGLVEESVDWEFSSAMDYFGKRKGTLVNKSVTKEYISLKGNASSE